MPIVTRRTKRLLPLEENPIHDERSVMEDVPVATRKNGDTVNSNDRETFVEIGTTILTARSCDVVHSDELKGESREQNRPVSFQECEIFQPIQPQSLAMMKNEMEQLWDHNIPMIIEIKGQSFPYDSEARPPNSLLLEQWTLQVVPKRSHCAHAPIQFLHQAVTSFLHFSQIRSWMVASKGSLPFQLLFRVCAPGEDEDLFTVHQPDRHCFPLAVVCEHYSLMVTVRCLPRLPHIPPNLVGGNTSKQQKFGLTESVKPQEPLKSTWVSVTREVFSSTTHQSIDDLSQRAASLYITPTSSSDLSLGSTRKATHVNTASTDTLSGCTFPFSPPQPSPMSPKLLSGLSDVLPYRNLQETIKKEELIVNGRNCHHSNLFCFDSGCVAHQPLSQQDPRDEVPGSKLNKGRGLIFQRRSESCSYPLQPSGVCPPSASSPIPFARKATNEKRRSLAISIKVVMFCFTCLKCNVLSVIILQRPVRPPVRSNSAPSVVPSLYLLGTFEESVLNGRLEPCGYVDGFSAELGASGSFCPRHITLPVTASFFSLAEHGGTSPYLGQVDLSVVGKRGYRIPKKGTVQVTLLNPNKTVVKIYFVKYDFSDMPPNSHTFLRHKTLSQPYLGSPVPAVPVLHYLIHLSFLCSKSGHLYLHRNIRLIFARRAPDTDPDLSKVSLYYTTDGPTDPKYGPIHSH